MLSDKDLYNQTKVVKNNSFSASFSNIFIDYPLGQIRVGDKV